MRLLIVTQNVDRTDPILGFFHRWIQEFSSQCESVIVIGQKTGEYDLSSNVQVISLGKERGVSRIVQVWHFLQIIWSKQRQYDAVFVHMTPVWMVLGGKLWWILRKKRMLWYAAKGGGWMLPAAVMWSQKVFTSTPDGLPIQTKKKVVTGQGIDTTVFAPPESGERDASLLVSVGRITRSKRLHMLVDTLAALGPNYRLNLIGEPRTPSDQEYKRELMGQIEELGLADRVTFGPVPPKDLPRILQKAALFLHASETTLDKAVLESMACGCPVVSCCAVVQQVLPEQCKSTAETFVQDVGQMLQLPEEDLEAIRRTSMQEVQQHHTIQALVQQFVGGSQTPDPSPQQ